VGDGGGGGTARRVPRRGFPRRGFPRRGFPRRGVPRRGVPPCARDSAVGGGGTRLRGAIDFGDAAEQFRGPRGVYFGNAAEGSPFRKLVGALAAHGERVQQEHIRAAPHLYTHEREGG